MSSFDERKKGFEKKFVHDEEKQFKINAKKNKYLGEWASQILGYDEENQKQYIQDVIKACLLYTSPSPRDKRQSRMPSSA